MRLLSKRLFFLFLFSLFFLSALPKTIHALGKDISSYNIEDYNNDRRARISAAENEDKTLIEGAGVGRFQWNTMILHAADSMTCLDMESKYCNQKETAIGGVTSAIAYIYDNPPASGIAYTRHVLANAGFVKPVYAQGVGFSALTSFLPFWKATRNVAYAAIILVMIAIGFMVIFRMKIDPKTIISIQAAIPKIVLTLVLVTLSYPIVGFMIDIMYLAMAMAISLMVKGMGGNVGGAGVAELQSTYMTAGFLDLLGAVFWPVQAVFLSFWKQLIGAGVVSGLVYGLGSAGLMLPVFGAFGLPFLGLAVGLPSLILLLIVLLGLLFTFIRLFLLLLNSYIQVLIALILGPIILLGEAFPGKSVFVGWLTNILANLVVFPATAVIIMFSVFLAVQGQVDAPTFSPPFLGAASPGGGTFHAFLGLGVMFIAPTLVAQIKKAFKPTPILPITPGTMLAPITGSFQTGLGAASQFYYAQSSLAALKGMFGKSGKDEHH